MPPRASPQSSAPPPPSRFAAGVCRGAPTPGAPQRARGERARARRTPKIRRAVTSGTSYYREPSDDDLCFLLTAWRPLKSCRLNIWRERAAAVHMSSALPGRDSRVPDGAPVCLVEKLQYVVQSRTTPRGTVGCCIARRRPPGRPAGQDSDSEPASESRWQERAWAAPAARMKAQFLRRRSAPALSKLTIAKEHECMNFCKIESSDATGDGTVALGCAPKGLFLYL